MKTAVGLAEPPDDSTCPPHVFVTCGPGIDMEDGVDRCEKCGMTWRDWTRGFGTNVNPKRVVR